jgi:HTH-like domain
VAAFIAAQRADHGIPHAVSCRAVGVSESWFYKWKDGNRTARRVRRDRLEAGIDRLFARRKGKDGSPRITAALREAGWTVGENTVAGLMRQMGLAARPKARRKGSTRPGKGRWRAPDLARRDFGAAAVNRKWYGDGTEIPRGRASCTWTACWTWARAGSSGSPSASTTTPTWPTARWPWRWRCAAVPCPASSCIPIMPRTALSRGIAAWPVRAGLLTDSSA